MNLVPQPKQVNWSAEAPWEVKAQGAAIVIGERATAPEAYAAELLRDRVAKRFRQEWPIVREGAATERQGFLVVLGLRASNRELDRLCTERAIDVSAESPGHDGYAIETFEAGGKRVALIAGCNPRGAVYGQDTFFQMLSGKKGGVLVHRAAVRDRPTVPWRGRPQTHYEQYLRPGELETYMTSRINFIDLRDGIYAFEPGAELDKRTLARVVAEAHRRGLVIFGTVNCGVGRAEYPAALETFREFLDLGADGLWLSFDDKGPGDAPEEIVAQVIELARAHGISGSRLATTPPKGDYQEIRTHFNRLIAAVPGMEEALWFFTIVPSPQALADARAVGLKVTPSRWHNWTRPHSGFTHLSSGSLLAAGKRSYLNVPPLSEGWHSPSYAELAAGGDCVEAIMPWGGNTWGQYYIVPVIGWWGWSPEGHDWEAVRGRIYDIVYGPNQVEAAREFDDTLLEVEALFAYAWDASEWQPICPARLKRLEDREPALALFDRLERLQQRIAAGAVEESMLPAEELETAYVGAMRAELETGRIEALIDYPEYWWDQHQRKVLSAVYDGRDEDADRLTAEVREPAVSEIERIETDLGHLRVVPDYAKWWKGRLGLDAQGWRGLVARRREELAVRVWDYGYYQAKTSTMLQEANNPPMGWGTGRWEMQNKFLATILPGEREHFRGNWIAGVYDATPAAVFAHERRKGAVAGNYAEVEFRIPLSGRRDRLALMIFLSNHSKESIGLHYVKARWAGRHFIELLWDDTVLWAADLGRPRLEGEWFVVKLPPLPEELESLPVRLRVEDRKESESSTIAFVGPIRLVEFPE